MADGLNFNLNEVLKNQNSYLQRQYTAGENGQAAMAQRELENAQRAIEAEQGFLTLTLQQKIQELMVPDRVMQEFSDVAMKTLTGAIQPFLDWLEKNEVYYTENLFNTAIQADAKQLFYTKYALSKEAEQSAVGTQFYASY